MHCHHRQRSGYRWICTTGKTRQISSLPLIAINSLLILPETKSAFDNCNYLRHREPKKSPWLRSPANTSVRQNYSCDYWWNFYHPLHWCPLLHKHSFKFPYSRHYSTSHYIDQPGKKKHEYKANLSPENWRQCEPSCLHYPVNLTYNLRVWQMPEESIS